MLCREIAYGRSVASVADEFRVSLPVVAPLPNTSAGGRLDLVAATVPEMFREVTVLYMTAYTERVSANYATTRTKIRSLAYFWAYLAEVHPEVTCCRDVLPHHARGFLGWALAKSRTLQRDTARKGTEDRTTTYDWMVDVRAFFTDLCTWSTELGSPLADHTPRTVPLTTHDLNSRGVAAARARTTARMTASVMDLAREVPNIRAFALRRWHEAAEHLRSPPVTASKNFGCSPFSVRAVARVAAASRSR